MRGEASIKIIELWITPKQRYLQGIDGQDKNNRDVKIDRIKKIRL